ncbi:MAG: glycyl-tRNA synthetase [Terrestrivirus sp.]|uniref:glycine--tRNA ligase n=1 Tax=Terrestrivirus sp. TaxID=2487775 RepID=A0A3G4ZLI3_9VIRU|nr:MAG: glycyl-tRNA synthetase [Terrestrivirus sp.]
MNGLLKTNDKQLIANHLINTQFMTPSYQLYSGVTNSAGFQDYGVIGHKIKQNIINAWRKIMLLNNIHEVETPIITPFCVLKASGHVDRFTDFVITDKNGVSHRADHLVEDFMKVNPMNINLCDPIELEKVIKENKLIELSEDSRVSEKNLMISADSDFLRPEIAQGMFVNMKHYLDYFSNKLPFGIAQTGKSYRREISPHPFTRLREFTQAEIEYFFDPLDDTNNYYDDVRNKVLPLLTEQSQDTGQNNLLYTDVENAVNNKIICNQIMAVFLAKIIEFTKYIGLDFDKLRFRQHRRNEMAHYAVECWDLECFVDNKWLECIGVAHRESYDLSAHGIKGEFDMKRETFKMNKKRQLNFRELNKCFDKNGVKEIGEMLQNSNSSIDTIITQFQVPDKCINTVDEKVFDTFVPYTIEPSFGIDRLCYVVLNQNIYQREKDLNRLVLVLNDNIAPYKICVFQLSNNNDMINHVKKISKHLESNGIRTFTDFSTVSLGKKYVRSDEIGIPLAITVDFQTLTDNTVTVRNSVTMEQIRINSDKILDVVNII